MARELRAKQVVPPNTSALPELTERELQLVVFAWNETRTGYPSNRCIHELFEDQVQQTPHAVALVSANEQLTYDELNRQANQLAHLLREYGVGPEVCVGLYLQRSIELVISVLAILKAGGAYVPLDPEYPQQRLTFMLADAQVAILLTLQQFEQQLPAGDVPLLCLDRDWPLLARQATGNLPPVAQASNLAFILYTSGSTGRPKGVAVAHPPAVRLVCNTNYISITPTDTLAHLSNISFDAATFELWGALLNGARLLIIPRETALAPPTLAALLSQQGATIMFVTTALFHHLIQRDPAFFASLRAVLFGGETADVRWVSEALQHGPPGELINVYGPTENTTFSTSFGMRELPETPTTISIGHAIANSQAYVLDEWMKPVVIGVTGELFVGGDGLARGYLARPEITAASFVPHPFSREAGARLYKTGDLVRWRPDGELEFVGRRDHQVKIRGFRIELGEIETALLQYPRVREAVVLLRLPTFLPSLETSDTNQHEDEQNEKQLVAYYVPSAPITPKELRDYLQQRLPDYMLPAAFIQLPTLPLTPNGKIDRAALPAPQRGDFAQEEQYEAPRTALEEQIATIWREIFHLEAIGVHDNFFSLGGHSLLATQIVSRLSYALAVDVPLRIFFESPTVASLAAYLQQELSAAPSLSPQPISHVMHSGNVVASFAQERLWFLNQLGMGNAFSKGISAALYNILLAARLSRNMQATILQQSLNEIIRRQEALCTTFQAVGGRPMQVISAECTLQLALVDLTHLSPEKQQTELACLAVQEAHMPFVLHRWPLMRATLFRIDHARYVLFITMHHIISDGWSQAVLLRELLQLYDAFAAGKPSPLPDLSIQYADYALWQRQWLQGEALEQQLSYWQAQLAGSPVLLELPTDHPRSAIQSFRGSRYPFTLSPDLSRQLRALSQQEGVTLYMLLLAAFQTLLWRYSGQEDLLVGSPIAGRTRREMEDVIGLFVNTLVMRTNLAGDPSFAEVLKRVQQTALAAYAHQDVPFERIVEALQPERSLSYQPLVQVMFALQNALVNSAELVTLGLEVLEYDTQMAEFDLALFIWEDENYLHGAFEYNTDLFEAPTIQRLWTHLQRLLEAIVADPQQRLSQLSWLSDAERRQLLVEWNATSAASSLDLPVHRHFEAQVARTPDAIALSCADQQLSYQHLDERATHLAQQLRELGLGSEDLIGLCLERSLDLEVALLASLKSGAAFVPLDPSWPSQRLRLLLQETGLQVILTQRALLEQLSEQVQHSQTAHEWRPPLLFAVDDLAEPPAGAFSPLRAIVASTLAYVLSTSGSTGIPKGVMVSQRALLNRLLWSHHALPLSSDDRVLQIAAFSFDIALWELLGPLVAGARVVLARAGVQQESAALLELLAREQITVAHFVPSLLQLLVEEAGWSRLSSLRLLLCGGEVVPVALAQRVHAQLAVEMFQFYGPTESAISVTSWPCEPQEGQARLPIGRPISNVRLYLLDGQMQPVAVGVSGELYIGGMGVARGYWGRPELTGERFVPDPYSEQGGERLYRTGDRGRYLPTGVIEFLGRVDRQVKLRGVRIELGEIEALLRQQSGVQEAVVILREDRPGDQRLVAYVVPAPPTTPALESSAIAQQARATHAQLPTLVTPAELRQALQERLPRYMLPSHFVILPALPLSSNGKIDWRALPPPQSEVELEQGYVAPRTPLEEQMAMIWQAVLQHKQVGIHDDFFALGGHSLLATQLMSRLCETFAIDIPLRALFEAPTIATLVASLRQSMTTGRGLLQSALLPIAPTGNATVSFAQERMWFLDQMQPGNPSYNIAAAFRLHGQLHVAALLQSFDTIVARHESLRTTFAVEEGQPVPVISPPPQLPLPVLDVSNLHAEEREILALYLLQQEARHAFDLARGPLLRLMLLRLSEREHILSMTMHHVIADGWSITVLLRELSLLYTATAARQPAILQPLPVQYADYALWQRQWLQGEALEQQLSYWRAQLVRAPALLELPTDHPRPALQSFRGSRYPFALSPDLSRQLRALSQREGVTLYMLLLAAFQTLLWRYSGQEDVLVGSPIAGRTRREMEDVIGLFVNTLVMRTNLSGDPPFERLLKRVQQMALAAYAHQDVPFERIVEALQPQRSLSYQPLVQVIFALNTRPQPTFGDDLRVQLVEVSNQTARFDLELEMIDLPGELCGAFEYNTDLFAPATIERMITHWQRLLEAIVADPQQRISQLSWPSDSERHRLLREWNNQQALPISQSNALAAAQSYEAPRTPLEEQMASIWSAVLRLERVGRREHFFALGGHSLLATQVLSRMRAISGVEVPLRAFFETPTIAALAEYVQQAYRPQLPPIMPVARTRSMPTSFAQERLWFLDQLEAGNPSYNIPFALRLRGLLHVALLAQSFNATVARHESFRTTFAVEARRPIQVIASALPVSLPVIDESSCGEVAQKAETLRLLRIDARHSFDLSRGPLLRIMLLRLSSQEHILCINMHHIIADGWSIDILLRELLLLYSASLTGQPASLPALPIQYADYAAWQRQAVIAEQLAYWQGKLSNAPHLLELPTDHPRPAMQSHRGQRFAFALTPDLSRQLRALSQQEGVTLYMLLLAAFQTLLWRYSGQEDVLVGSPIAGRTRREMEDVIGLFVNTLVMRTNLAGDPSFAEALKRVQQTALAAYAHQDVPFERIVEALRPQRSLSYQPLVQVMFSLHMHPGVLSAEGLQVELMEIDTQTAKFDLELEMSDLPVRLHGAFEYNTDLFEAPTIQRLWTHLQRLLEAIVADPQQRLSQLSWLSDAERRQLLVEWNATSAASSLDLPVHRHFEAQVARTPDAIALSCADQQLSYQHLDERATHLAQQLRELGLGSEDLIGLCLERSLDLEVALLASLKSGAAFVPLDPSWPSQRLRLLLQETGLQVILTQRALLEQLSEQVQHSQTAHEWRPPILLPVDDLVESPAGAFSPLRAIVASTLAYVLSTSGSTGIPKGVMVSQRALLNRLLWSHHALPLSSDDRVLQIAAFSFDIALWELLGPLVAGARVVLARAGVQQESAALLELLAREQITVAHFVPSLLQLLVEEAGWSRLSSLRLLLCGGEVVPVALAQRVHAQLAVEMFQFYGPTESAISVTSWPCEPQEGQARLPIGRPISNVRLYLLDGQMQPVAVGVSGELYIGGMGVARGYWGRPELTGERFVPDPYSEQGGERLYRTGDRGRYLPTGVIEFLGRVDRQVKLRGVRIELGEIEALLRQQSGVQEAVVILREQQEDKQLIAYVVPAPEAQLNRQELRQALLERLPTYMMPAFFVILSTLPLTANGKIDWPGLPPPEENDLALNGRFEAPRSLLEEQIAAIWQAVLQRGQVGRHDDFFALGGHSLLATQVMSRLRETFAVEVPLRTLFEMPTIAALANYLQEAVQHMQEAMDEEELDITSLSRGHSTMDQLVATLENLSPAEVRLRLASAQAESEKKAR